MNEWFSLEGLYFQTPGSDIERSISLKAVLQVVRNYCEGRERAEDAERALAYVEQHVAKTKQFVDMIRSTYQMDDFLDDQKAEICKRAMRGIERRLGNKPV